jgi:glycosyltransferase involved in cell wall biosynthesis
MALVAAAERQAVRRSDSVVTLSKFMKDEVTRLHGVPTQRVVIVPGGVDTELFSPLPCARERAHIRAGMGLPPDAFVLLAVKRLYEGMGLDTLINALVLLNDSQVRLLIAGDGPSRGRLDALVAKQGLRDQVRFLGNVPHGQMVSLYGAADLLISTRAEPFGLVMLEALACGLPVLSVPLGGAVEILEGLPWRLLSASPSSEDMADLIRQHMAHPEGLLAIGSAAREYVAAKYSWRAMAATIDRLLTQPSSAKD